MADPGPIATKIPGRSPALCPASDADAHRWIFATSPAALANQIPAGAAANRISANSAVLGDLCVTKATAPLYPLTPGNHGRGSPPMACCASPLPLLDSC